MYSLFSFLHFFLIFKDRKEVFVLWLFGCLFDKKRLSRPDSWENLLVKSAYTYYFILFLNY